MSRTTIETPDGFKWEVIPASRARLEWLDETELFVFHPKDYSEGAIDSEEDLDRAIELGLIIVKETV